MSLAASQQHVAGTSWSSLLNGPSPNMNKLRDKLAQLDILSIPSLHHPSSTMSPSAETVAMQALSILAILAMTMPLILHWKNRNFPASMLMVWYIVLNIFNVVNAFIWPNEDTQKWYDGSVLCDIEVKVMVGSYVAVPGTLICIFRALAIVLDTSRATLVPSRRQRWQSRAFEFLFCVFVPLMAATMHIVYQGNRYFILQVSGCVTSLDQSWVSLALGYVWPLVVCLIASYYCGTPQRFPAHCQH